MCNEFISVFIIPNKNMENLSEYCKSINLLHDNYIKSTDNNPCCIFECCEDVDYCVHEKHCDDKCNPEDCKCNIICDQARVINDEAKIFSHITNRLICELCKANSLDEIKQIIDMENSFLYASAEKEKAVAKVLTSCAQEKNGKLECCSC